MQKLTVNCNLGHFAVSPSSLSLKTIFQKILLSLILYVGGIHFYYDSSLLRIFMRER